MMHVKYLVPAFLLLVMLSGCGSSDLQTQPQPQVQPVNGQAKFIIDNNIWAAGATYSATTGILTAYRGNEHLQIQLSSPYPGTYNISASSSPSVRLNQYANVNYDSYGCSPAGGQIQITEFDGEVISGYFNAKVCGGGNSKEIINGVFSKIVITQ